MSHEISIEYKGEYLHVRHTGEDSYEISRELWQRVMKACEEHHCYNILGESDNTNVLSMLDAFKHILIFREVGASFKHRIAWVNHNPKANNIYEYLEHILTNRFVGTGHLFKTVEEAKRWLLSRVDAPVP
jgi:hypothetical protein